jgi:CHASE2 domain-containing sensor protein
MTIPEKRTELYQFLLKLPGPQFDAVVFALNPPKGNIPPSQAAQAQRVDALFEWLESSVGPGLAGLKIVLKTVLIDPLPPLSGVQEIQVTDDAAIANDLDTLPDPSTVLIDPLPPLSDVQEIQVTDDAAIANDLDSLPDPSDDRVRLPETDNQPDTHPRQGFNALPWTAMVSGLIIATAVVISRFFGVFETFELRAYDHVLTARLSVPEELSDRIIIVEADRSVVEAEKANVPKNLTRDMTDSTLINVLNQLKNYGVSVIGIDWYLPTDAEKWTETALQAFQSSEISPTIYGVCAQPYEGHKGIQDAVPAPNPQAIPKEQVGFSNFSIDQDEVLRRQLVSNGLGDTAITSTCQSEVAFSTLIALRYLEQERPELGSLDYLDLITPEPENNLQIGNVVIKRINALIYGGYQNLDTAAFELLLNYREPPGNDLRNAFTHVSIQDLLVGTVEPSKFKDKIVLMGLTADGLAGDEFTTPYGKVFGVTLQAHMVDNIISIALGERQQIRAFGQGFELGWILLCGIAGGMLGYYCRRPWWSAGSLMGGIFFIYLSCRLTMVISARWIPMITPMAAFTLSHVIVVYTETKLRATNLGSIGPHH